MAICEMVAGLGHRMEGRRMGGALAEMKKRRRKMPFSLSDWDYKPFWAAARQKMEEISPREQAILARIRAFPKLFSVLAPQLTSRKAKLLALKIRATQLKKERDIR